jgi:hypothetical protein
VDPLLAHVGAVVGWRSRAKPGSAPSYRSCTSSRQPPPEGGFVYEVGKGSLTVDLDHRQPLAVSRLQLGVAGDVDLRELEIGLRGERAERLPRPLAEMAAGRVVENDLRRYGYRPLVVVASATRMTASP